MSKNFITHIPNVHNWAKIKLIFILSEIFQNETIKSYSTEKDDIGRGGGGLRGVDTPMHTMAYRQHATK